MKLTNEMKLLIAFCYSDANALRYEFVFDKPCDYFAVRFFLGEYNYLLAAFDYNNPNEVVVTEWEVVKSHYHPSQRCTNLNKYYKRFRNTDKSCTVPIKTFIDKLGSMPMPQGFTRDRSSYKEWRSVRRASGRY